jgi:hypothetical protein
LGRTDAKLTLVSGQLLQGNGTNAGALDVGLGATVSPGESIGIFTVSGAVVLRGITRVELDKASATQDLLQTPTSINYGGTLSLTNLSENSNPLAAGDSFKIFDSGSATYIGSFTNITPSTPGPGLGWNTSSLAVDGTIKVVSTLSPPGFGSIALSGPNIILSGTNGTPGTSFAILTATNIILPSSLWTTQAVGTFLIDGIFSYTNALNRGEPMRFYRIKTP